MTDFVVDKDIITLKILSIIDGEYTERDLYQARFRWWVDPAATSGLRLTEHGKKAFDQAGIQQYIIQHNNVADPRDLYRSYNLIVLDLNRFLPCPYYIVDFHLKLIIYDSRVAMMIELHETVLSYLTALKKLKGK